MRSLPYMALCWGDENGKDADGRTAPQRLKEDRLLEMPADARAEYITRTFDESGVEILKKGNRAGHPQIFPYSVHVR